MALQVLLARWAPHCAESAPQPPGFAGVTCLLSIVFGCTALRKDLRDASAHRLLLHVWEPQFSHL